MFEALEPSLWVLWVPSLDRKGIRRSTRIETAAGLAMNRVLEVCGGRRHEFPRVTRYTRRDGVGCHCEVPQKEVLFMIQVE